MQEGYSWVGPGSTIVGTSCHLSPVFKDKETSDFIYYLGPSCLKKSDGNSANKGDRFPVETLRSYTESGWDLEIVKKFEGDVAHLSQGWGKLVPSNKPGQTRAQVLQSGYIADPDGKKVWPITGTKDPSVGLKVVRGWKGKWYEGSVDKVNNLGEGPMDLTGTFSFARESPGYLNHGEAVMEGNSLVGVGVGQVRDKYGLAMKVESIGLGFEPPNGISLVLGKEDYLAAEGIVPDRPMGE
ncbi:hypothetical protein AUCHE_16_00790 [Austwickia chelonae NBRC 105200]|uniref:Uncharacterized protein n=2 Tax=Austwickia TaxID=1184606 RepID=K6UN39_9MICO|nr:hypothetical protein AUCHE_16_00790 [Austwickia chelonae NBRC 105200]